MPPTPQQISPSSTDESQWQAGLKAQQRIWSTRERTVIARMKNHLYKSGDVILEVGGLELLMDPEGSEVNVRYILTHARRRGSRTFEIFSTKEKSDHLVASRNRWLEFKEGRAAREVAKRSDRHEPRRNDSTGSCVPPKKDEDAAAAAELFVDKGAVREQLGVYTIGYR